MNSKNIISSLVEALPYISEFKNKIFIIKYGGSIHFDDTCKNSFVDDISILTHLGMKIVIVHGGGKEITKRLESAGINSQFSQGLRITCEQSIEEVEMVLSGKINSELTMLFNSKGVISVGLNGKDANLIIAKKKLLTSPEGMIDIGFVGDVSKVNFSILKLLLDNGITPIISPIGFDENNHTYNINADTIASAIAKEISAEKLILITDTDGIYKNFSDKNSLISELSYNDALVLLKSGSIDGGMIPKLECAADAITGGTKAVHIINGLTEHCLLLEIFTEDGIGTIIRKENKNE